MKIYQQSNSYGQSTFNFLTISKTGSAPYRKRRHQHHLIENLLQKLTGFIYYGLVTFLPRILESRWPRALIISAERREN